MITPYAVTGMTCQHCVDAVTEEVAAVPGVNGVRVDLAAGRLEVISETSITFDQVQTAVAEAGYVVHRVEPGS